MGFPPPVNDSTESVMSFEETTKNKIIIIITNAIKLINFIFINKTLAKDFYIIDAITQLRNYVIALILQK